MITRSRRPRPAVLAAAALGAVLAGGLVTGCDAAEKPVATPVPAEAGSSPAAAAPQTTPAAQETSSAAAEEASTATPGDAGPSTAAPASAGAGSGKPVVDRPTTYAEAEAEITDQVTSGASVKAVARFSTPGDAIYCLFDGFVACELRVGAIADPDICANALGDAVGRIEFTDQGALPQCNTDTIREPGATTIAPPAVVTAGAVTCAVEKIGVTCVDESTRTGFFLAPGDYATFS
ncbi:hypothetical protein E8D34_14965 [Nocardioides sp. GY 10113]|uniref:hypothetical protein n=1 Tax=Nocardioides sp. GY 10113 TaxID=2569761 RepID=UPI0010A85469|nr:hypothetical protein [Nocardioides sp. GY 10113]TIC83862.1 hypothetical protein E8D34_14965 [Nocardioides sp. GY 10113]